MLPVPPPVLALGAAVLQRRLPGESSPPTRSRAAVATALTVASVAVAGAAGREFRRHGTTVEPFRPERASALVTTGSNAVTRNPMYVGMAGGLLAHAVWRGSWPALVPVAVFVGVIDRLQVEAEETALLGLFGAEYATYRSTVPRWLGLRPLMNGGGRHRAPGSRLDPPASSGSG